MAGFYYYSDYYSDYWTILVTGFLAGTVLAFGLTYYSLYYYELDYLTGFLAALVPLVALTKGDLVAFLGAYSSDDYSDYYWTGFFFCWGFWSGDLATGDLVATGAFLVGLTYS